MKQAFRILSSLAAFGAAALVSHAQPAPKVFVVDMAKLYESHYKTEENNNKLRADEQKAQTELERLSKEGQTLVDKYKGLAEQVESNRSSPVVSNDAKAKAEKEAQEVMEEIQKKQQEVQNFRRNVEGQLQQRMHTFREFILEEIGKTATDIAKRKGATLLIDKAGPSGFGISNFIYLDPAYDITEEVLKEVNKDRPVTAAPAPAATTGATKAPATTTPAPASSDAPTVTFPGAKKN